MAVDRAARTTKEESLLFIRPGLSLPGLRWLSIGQADKHKELLVETLTKQSSSGCQLPTVSTKTLSVVSVLFTTSHVLWMHHIASHCHALHQSFWQKYCHTREWRTFRDNVVYSSLWKKMCKRTERAISKLREWFRSSPLSYFCHPLLSGESLLPCPLDPLASPDLLLLLRLWLSPLFSKDHMLANGPPGWAAWRLEGSLVDPPISPGPWPWRSGARPAVQRAPWRPQSFVLMGDRQRWVEERQWEAMRGERGNAGWGWWG